MPTVDRPVVEVDGKEVDRGVSIPLPIQTRSTATALTLLKLNKANSFTRKETSHINDNLQYVPSMNQAPKD